MPSDELLIVDETLTEVSTSDDKHISDNTEPSQELVEKAKKMGWTPKDEFKGDPGKWRGAEEFVERGENLIPILKKTTERQQRRIDDLERSIKSMADYHTKLEQISYEKAVKHLKEAQVQAVGSADVELFNKVSNDISEIERSRGLAPQIKDPNEALVAEWAEDNPLFKRQDVADASYSVAYALRAQGNQKSGVEFLDEVARETKKRYPEFFENPKRANAPAVESVKSQFSKKSNEKSFDNLPKDAKEVCLSMEKKYGKDGFKRDSFVKNYYGE